MIVEKRERAARGSERVQTEPGHKGREGVREEEEGGAKGPREDQREQRFWPRSWGKGNEGPGLERFRVEDSIRAPGPEGA